MNNIRLFGDQFSESRIVEEVISTLPEKYEAKISSLEDSRDLSSISLTELINALYTQEQRRASRQEKHHEGAFQAKSRPTSSSSGYERKKTWSGKPKRDGARKRYPHCSHCKRISHPETNYWYKPNVQCKVCKQLGHVEKVCKNKKQHQAQQFKIEAQVAEESNAQEKQVFVVSCSIIKRHSTKGWLIGSGCTNHMTPDAAIFKSMDRYFNSRVKVGNGQYIKAEGKGDVLIDTPSCTKLISNVLLVPEIDKNLLSIAQLHKKRYSVVLKGKEYLISDPSGSKLMSVAMTNRSFVIDWTKGSISAYTTVLDESKLWHRRLGHLSKEDLVENFTKVVEQQSFYEVCQLGKYFIIFIDDYSRFRWVYFLKVKSEVASVFWTFKTVAKIQSGYKLRTISSDNGTEYTFDVFQRFCEESGIEHQLTYTPQQNGVSKRKNRTLMDMAKCLMLERSLLRSFWAEVVNIVVYLPNKLPTKSLFEKTPFKAWFGFKPSVAHLKVFVSRDVVFDEMSTWNGDKGEPECVAEDLVTGQIDVDQCDQKLNIDHVPVRETKLISEIYERAYVATVEPTCFEEAQAQEDWRQTMLDEMSMIHKNQTWELVARLVHRKVIGVKWARLVVKEFGQKYEIDYFETFALMARLDTIRLLVLDIKSAFFNGFLDEEIYVEQPNGFKVVGEETKVYKLRKALYGLKQAPRAWYDKIDTFLSSLGFEGSISEPTLYVKKEGGETQLIVSLYVDDLLVTGGNDAMLTNIKCKIESMFEMSDLGEMPYFLGMEVSQTQQGIFISQKAFALKILNRFSMQNCKVTSTPVAVGEKLTSQGDFEKVNESTYKSVVRCLLYLTATRPDIMFAVSFLSRFMHCCNVNHFSSYKESSEVHQRNSELWSYVHQGSIDDMKSTSGYLFTLGSTVFCWSSKKQSIVAQSTAEAKDVAAATAVNQAIWLRKLMVDMNLHQREATEIRSNNQSIVAIAKNPVFHGKTKHFNIKFYFVREVKQSQEIKPVHCSSEDHLSDILTKPLGVSRFENLRARLGVCSIEAKEEC
ncbi:pleiotropic drug resistance protein 3-like [Gossypium australe]|uniref:Pleiotropic drug resistance protein 3-like n=1 Tax=Gossypium australe TaxID=47621 RepID=A0A5B6UN20_9ROSI|nr:pleiotropic drug resistance protein 3-like [Gossypium australe]